VRTAVGNYNAHSESFTAVVSTRIQKVDTHQ